MGKKKHAKKDDTVLWLSAAAGVLAAGAFIYREVTRYRLENRVILITGGSRGLGLQLARELGGRGARIAICARTEEQLQNAGRELDSLGIDNLVRRADLTDRNQVQQLVEEVVAHFGTIDVLINNAGIIQVGPQTSMAIKDYEDAMDTNFWAALYGMHAVLPHFFRGGQGRIVNITSIGGKVAVPHLLPYTASKFALVGLSEGMNAELKKHNIHVTTVVPNLMNTGSPRNAVIKGQHEKEYAWFKVSDASPLLSQDVDVAAKGIVRALEYGESEAVLNLSAKAATMLQGIAPSWVSFILSAVNRFLPGEDYASAIPMRGHEVESKLSKGPVGKRSDKAATANNEM